MSAGHDFRVSKSSLLWYWNIAYVLLEQFQQHQSYT